MLFGEIITIYSENKTKSINTICEQNARKCGILHKIIVLILKFNVKLSVTYNTAWTPKLNTIINQSFLLWNDFQIQENKYYRTHLR